MSAGNIVGAAGAGVIARAFGGKPITCGSFGHMRLIVLTVGMIHTENAGS